MKQINHYIQWQHNATNSLDGKVAEIMKHWQNRYELGSAVLLTDSPTTALKNVIKQWRKMSRQLQAVRETKQSAEEILEITRTISRMQRVKFTTKDPSDDPDATFYLLKPDQIETLPAHCYTLYSLAPEVSPMVLDGLAADALLVLYQTKQPSLSHLKEKANLEHRLQLEEKDILGWLEKQGIVIANLQDNLDATNEALDTLLSSGKLQAEFLHKIRLFLHTLQLAQPLTLDSEQAENIESLKQLEKHVRVLSSGYLTDHIIDTSSDDSFLLRESATGRQYGFNSLKEFIAEQYTAGRTHLAAALEQHAGFARI